MNMYCWDNLTYGDPNWPHMGYPRELAVLIGAAIGDTYIVYLSAAAWPIIYLLWISISPFNEITNNLETNP